MKRQARGTFIVAEVDTPERQEILSCRTELTMARVKRGVTTHARHRKILKLAKGYRGRSSTNFRIAIEKVEKALRYAYRDRRDKKRDFRALWIQRINAGCAQQRPDLQPLHERPEEGRRSNSTARFCPTSRRASRRPSRRWSTRPSKALKAPEALPASAIRPLSTKDRGSSTDGPLFLSVSWSNAGQFARYPHDRSGHLVAPDAAAAITAAADLEALERNARRRCSGKKGRSPP